jgi:hypothetical protein
MKHRRDVKKYLLCSDFLDPDLRPDACQEIETALMVALPVSNSRRICGKLWSSAAVTARAARRERKRAASGSLPENVSRPKDRLKPRRAAGTPAAKPWSAYFSGSVRPALAGGNCQRSPQRTCLKR